MKIVAQGATGTLCHGCSICHGPNMYINRLREMTQQWDRDASISDRLSERGAIESPNLLCTRTDGLLFDSDALLSAIERYFGEKEADLVKDAQAGYIATIRNHPDVRKESQATRIGLPPRGHKGKGKGKNQFHTWVGTLPSPVNSTPVRGQDQPVLEHGTQRKTLLH